MQICVTLPKWDNSLERLILILINKAMDLKRMCSETWGRYMCGIDFLMMFRYSMVWYTRIIMISSTYILNIPWGWYLLKDLCLKGSLTFDNDFDKLTMVSVWIDVYIVCISVPFDGRHYPWEHKPFCIFTQASFINMFNLDYGMEM